MAFVFFPALPLSQRRQGLGKCGGGGYFVEPFVAGVANTAYKKGVTFEI